MCVADVCGGTVPANATSNATGQTVSKNWAYNTTPGQCTFKCDNNYNWSGGACVAGTQTYTCPTATNPANKVWNTVASYTQTWNGSAWMPAGTSTIYSTSADTQSCRVACGSGYHTEDSGSTCISNTKSCTIANGTGSQTWNGSTWGTCTLVSCDSNYHASGNTCVADAQNANCSGSVPTNASASATTFTQTWNGSAWTPTTTNYAYQAANCGYTCNINFHTEDSGASCT